MKLEHAADCTLWTPWGPQITEAANPRLASLRRRLRRIKSKPEAKQREPDELLRDKPECSYEP